jgi:hypothetical protein
MRYNRALHLLIPAISAIFLTTNFNVSFASDVQSSLSQATIIECRDGSCYTVSCSNDQPCQTSSSDQPSLVQPSQEVTTPIMQPADGGSVMQPIEDSTEQYIEVPVEFCDDGLDNDDDGKVDEECG